MQSSSLSQSPSQTLHRLHSVQPDPPLSTIGRNGPVQAHKRWWVLSLDELRRRLYSVVATTGQDGYGVHSFGAMLTHNSAHRDAVRVVVVLVAILVPEQLFLTLFVVAAVWIESVRDSFRRCVGQSEALRSGLAVLS